ncbi:hypothetical protein NPIL_552361 [Nephila pilipes]|uniref:Uncharacterized protein n=1 Tax=Nephila pilipes TaxID=299642 RepID=A0A8X6UD77_NEPPI|nr:hypothetical protein NPIL_552361 [Nephila pilipes]
MRSRMYTYLAEEMQSKSGKNKYKGSLRLLMEDFILSAEWCNKDYRRQKKPFKHLRRSFDSVKPSTQIVATILSDSIGNRRCVKEITYDSPVQELPDKPDGRTVFQTRTNQMLTDPLFVKL